MPGIREKKKQIRRELQSDNWASYLPSIIHAGKSALGALFSCLLLEPEIRHRAAIAIGQTTAAIAKRDPEAAKEVCRRFMWHMNEDSGNIGWGIPEAFAETLCASPELAKVYAPILISYIMDLGHADNYCDHDILRRSCYWAAGRLAQCRPALAEAARPWLLKGLRDHDAPCRGMAAWALSQLPPSLMDMPELRKLAMSNDGTPCEFFAGDTLQSETVSQIAQAALKRLD